MAAAVPQLAAAAPNARRAAAQRAARPAAPPQSLAPQRVSHVARLGALLGTERAGEGGVSGASGGAGGGGGDPAQAEPPVQWQEAGAATGAPAADGNEHDGMPAAPAADGAAPAEACGQDAAEWARGAATADDARAAPPTRAQAFLLAIRALTALEVCVAVLYVALTAITLALCVSPPDALPPRLMGAALAGVLCRFVREAAASARGVALSGDDDAARALRPWLALRLAADLGGAALASATRNGCAGATMAVCGHLVYNLATDKRLKEYGDVYAIEPRDRRLLIGGGAALTAVGVLACVTAEAGPPAVALAASAAFLAAVGCWLLALLSKHAALLLLARAYAGQRC